MNKRWFTILLFLGLLSGALLLSCSDNTDNNNPPPPPRLVGTWDADTTTLVHEGLTQYTYYFNSDLSYRYYRQAGTTVIDERGDWDLASDSIRFHATWRDSVTVNEVYEWRYRVVQGAAQADDVLHIWVFEDPGYFEATFHRAP